MSIVGPRPLLIDYLPYYTEKERHRHDVRPGLTGLAQVKGRNNLDWEERFSEDLNYINNISFLNDLKIIIFTIIKVLHSEGIEIPDESHSLNAIREKQKNNNYIYMVVEKNINKLEKDWVMLEKNSNCSPIQYYEYQKNIKNKYFPYMILKRAFPKYFAFYKEGKCIMIAPMCQIFSLKNNYLELITSPWNLSFNDFVYSRDLNEGELKLCLEMMLSKYHIIFKKIRYDTLLAKVLDNYNQMELFNRNDNVEIICSDYEKHYNGLSKSVKQNIRTAYNRLAKDNRTYSFEVINGKIDESLIKDLLKIYIKRRSKRYKFISPLKKIYINNYDANTNALRNLDNLLFILKIDGKIAAFCQGIAKNDNSSIYIPRLTIDSDYSRYSPGMIIVNEILKILYLRYNIEVFDLASGSEKYKIDFGGKIYYTNDYKKGDKI